MVKRLIGLGKQGLGIIVDMGEGRKISFGFRVSWAGLTRRPRCSWIRGLLLASIGLEVKIRTFAFFGDIDVRRRQSVLQRVDLIILVLLRRIVSLSLVLFKGTRTCVPDL